MARGATIEQMTQIVAEMGSEFPQSSVPGSQCRTLPRHSIDAGKDDILNFLEKHSVDYWLKEKPGMRIYELRQCPFNPVHRRSGFLVDTQTGLTGFHCHHNSCSDFKCRDAIAKIRSNTI